MMDYKKTRTKLKRGHQVPYAEAIRREAGIPTMAVGVILDGPQAEAILQAGQADLIAIGREALTDPHWALARSASARHRSGLEQVAAFLWLVAAASRFDWRRGLTTRDIKMDIRLDGRVVILSGAAQGIGRAMAHAFRDAGARIHLTDLEPVGLAAAGDALSAPVHACDLSDREAAHRLVTDVIAQEGRLDILALAAGGVRGQVGRPLEEISERDWRVLFEANVEAALWLSQASAPHFKAAGWGRIVSIASGAGLRRV